MQNKEEKPKEKEEVKTDEPLEDAIIIEEEYKEEPLPEQRLDEKQKMELAKLDNFSSVGEVMSFAQVLIRSNLVPKALRTPEKLVTVIQQGKELGMGAVTAMNNIHNIEGKPTLSVHAVNGLLRKAGVAIKTLRDYEPEYKTDELTGEVLYYKIEKGQFVVENGVAVRTTKEAGGKPKQIDTITTIRFYRKWEGMIIEEDVSFRWSDAVMQKLHIKSNWIKMPRIMMWNRCLVQGGRRIAPDALMGMYEVSEIADETNTIIELDHEGNPKEK